MIKVLVIITLIFIAYNDIRYYKIPNYIYLIYYTYIFLISLISPFNYFITSFQSITKYFILFVLCFPLYLMNIPGGDIKLLIFIIASYDVNTAIWLIFYALIQTLSFIKYFSLKKFPVALTVSSSCIAFEFLRSMYGY